MSGESFGFGARWSWFVRAVTVGVLVLVVVAEVLLVKAACGACDAEPGQLLAGLIGLLSVGIFGSVAWFAPWGYLVRPDAIVVRRLGPPLVISYEGIREVRRTDSQEIGFSWRVFGSAGFMGWFGWFRSRGLGEFHSYSTNQRDLVLVTRTNGKKIVLSPHPRDAFLEAVERNRKSLV